MQTPLNAARRIRVAPAWTGVRAYVFAVLLVVAAVILTRLGWGVLSRAPFAAMFFVVYAVARFCTKRAGFITIALGAIGAYVATPLGAGPAYPLLSLAVFASVSAITVYLVTERNRMVMALQASEADVTARYEAEAALRRSEEKLRQAQKMEAIGQLVAGVAHNFNNLLTITIGYTDLLIERHRGDEDFAELDEIRKASHRGASLVRHLLLFSRQAESTPTLVDLNLVLLDLRDILSRAIREDITLAVDVAAEPATVLIDEHDFEHVILNLVINARDALPRGGHVRITVSRQMVTAGSRLADRGIEPGEYVCIAVIDNGIGMTPEVQAHLFEPFFTTKDVGQGTGLGLASAYGMVRNHRGHVEVTSAPDAGTTVQLFLPFVASTVAPPAPTTGSPPRHESPAATILLVEDEESVRAVTAGALIRHGHRVFAAATVAEAIRIFDAHADEIDLLVSDIVMPEMRGPALADRLARRRPDLRVLFVSGYTEESAGTIITSDRVRFLSKPFSAERLLNTVDALLAGDAVPVDSPGL